MMALRRCPISSLAARISGRMMETNCLSAAGPEADMQIRDLRVGPRDNHRNRRCLVILGLTAGGGLALLPDAALPLAWLVQKVPPRLDRWLLVQCPAEGPQAWCRRRWCSGRDGGQPSPLAMVSRQISQIAPAPHLRPRQINHRRIDHNGDGRRAVRRGVSNRATSPPTSAGGDRLRQTAQLRCSKPLRRLQLK